MPLAYCVKQNADYRASVRARLTFSRISEAFAVQMKGLGTLVVFVDVFADGHDEFLGIVEDAATQAGFAVRSRKKRSTMFSHELLVGVKWTWKRGWRAKPALHFRMFVRRVVIDDQVEIFFRRRDLVDHTQELEPLLMAVPVVAHADDGAVEGIQAANRVAVPFRL